MKLNFKPEMLLILLIAFPMIMSDCGTYCRITLYVQNNNNKPMYFINYYFLTNGQVCVGKITPPLSTGEKYLIFEMRKMVKGGCRRVKCEETKEIKGIPTVYLCVTDTLSVNENQCFESADSLLIKLHAIKNYTITEDFYNYGNYLLVYP